MGCTRASSTLLVVLLAISVLLALDRPLVHARHVRSPSTTTGPHSSARKGTQDTSMPGVANARKTETAEAKGSTGSGPSFDHGASAEVAEVVVQRFGPRPHPKKHN